MPRPVLARLGVRYRRIPVLAVGRDMYCDSRCIIRMLEERYSAADGGTTPCPRLGVDATTHPYEAAMEQVLESWALENLFLRTSMLVPYDYFVAQSQAWIEDRRQLTGWTTTREGMAEKVPDAQTAARTNLKILNGLLSDGREFLAAAAASSTTTPTATGVEGRGDNHKPGLADVHVGWVFDWMYRGEGPASMKYAYPELLNEEENARVVAWVKRINVAVEQKKQDATDTAGPLYPMVRIDEDQAVRMIEEAALWEPDTLDMVQWDPTGLQDQRGVVEVDLYTTDLPSGIQNKDTGELVGLTADKVTIATRTKNGVGVRIHYPRSNVKVARVKST